MWMPGSLWTIYDDIQPEKSIAIVSTLMGQKEKKKERKSKVASSYGVFNNGER